MENVVKVAVATTIFAVVQYFSSRNMSLLAALVANIPFFTLYAYFTAKDPHKTALYLALFTGAISVSYFLVYLFGIKSRTFGVVMGLLFWVVGTLAIFYLFNGGR